jgi:hypothetical protein
MGVPVKQMMNHLAWHRAGLRLAEKLVVEIVAAGQYQKRRVCINGYGTNHREKKSIVELLPLPCPCQSTSRDGYSAWRLGPGKIILDPMFTNVATLQ